MTLNGVVAVIVRYCTLNASHCKANYVKLIELDHTFATVLESSQIIVQTLDTLRF